MTSRTINRSLIVHKDLALGTGTVVQERGSNTATEQKIELDFIFRTTDEIRYLDTTRYTRASLHTEAHYYFDVASVAVDDDDYVLAPIPVLSVGRWLKIPEVIRSATTANLADVTHAVNTMDAKQAGLVMWNVDLVQPVWAAGDAAADLWVDAQGVTKHSPV